MNYGNLIAIVMIVEQVAASGFFAWQGDYWRAANFLFGAGIILTVLKMR